MAVSVCATRSVVAKSGSCVRPMAGRRQLRRSTIVRAEVDGKQDANEIPATSPTAATSAKALSASEVMAFSGPLPETVNGRLAMLGFLSALGAEVVSGETVSQQINDAPLPILLSFVALAVASAIPIIRGANLQTGVGPFSPVAERVNGRAAMIGLVALVAVEFFRGSALF